MDLKVFICINICRQIYYLFFQIVMDINKNINKNCKIFKNAVNLLINNMQFS
jgi:hypothetical protein